LFNGPAPPSVVCRSSQAKEPVEWQADFYASCLLMPRKLVMVAWDEMFPDRKPRVLRPAKPIEHPFVEIDRMRRGSSGTYFTGSDELVLDHFVKPFADRFLLSAMAMRIRLEKLGLLHREVPHQHILAGGA
jgi:Zn-dependent peptidase ImmA (M78 family)